MSSVDKQSYCPFCSLFDPLILKVPDPKAAYFTRNSLLKIDYPTEPNYGLCPRGNYSVYLIDDNKRAYSGFIGRRPASAFEVISYAVEKLKDVQGKKGAILIDGGLSLDEAYLIVELAKLLKIGCVALNPVEDELIGRNVSFSHFERERILEGDFILIFGDPFESNPTIAKQILDAKFKSRLTRIIVVSSYPSKTSEHATGFIEILAGSDAIFALGLLKAVEGESFKKEAEICGVEVREIGAVVESLRNARKPFIILSAVCGQTFGIGELAGLLSKVAEKTETQILPLTQARNSIGISKIIDNATLKGNEYLRELMSKGELDYLISFGVNPSIVIPQETLQKLEFVVEANWFIPEPNDIKNYLFIPIATSLESKGIGINSFGDIIEYDKAINPAGDAFPLSKVLETIFFQLGSSVSVSKDMVLQVARKPQKRELITDVLVGMVEKFVSRKDGFKVVFVPSSLQVGDGFITNRLSFAKAVDCLPKALVSSRILKEFGYKFRIKTRDNIVLELEAEEDRKLKDNLLLLSSNYTLYRMLLPKLAHPLELGPIEVELEKVYEKESTG